MRLHPRHFTCATVVGARSSVATIGKHTWNKCRRQIAQSIQVNAGDGVVVGADVLAWSVVAGITG